MFISVIIPAYNSEKSIRRTVESVLSQTHKEFEIIVIDDGSNDSTAQAVAEYKSKVTYKYQENAGVCAARNAGVQISKGEWISFLDHDDIWDKCKLRRQVEILKKYPELKWCATNYFYNDGTRIAPACSPKRADKALKEKGYIQNFFEAMGHGKIRIMPTTVILKKDAFLKTGAWRTGLKRHEDTDFWCRLGMRYPHMGYIPEPLATRYLNIDVPNDVIELRRKAKTGEHMRNILARYFDDAEKMGCLNSYRVFAARPLKRTVLSCLYNNHPIHARSTLQQFKSLFPWYWRTGMSILIFFPKITAACFKFSARFAHLLNLDKKAGRRWLMSSTRTKQKN